MRDEHNLAKRIKELILNRGEKKECETALWWGEDGASGETSGDYWLEQSDHMA